MHEWTFLASAGVDDDRGTSLIAVCGKCGEVRVQSVTTGNQTIDLTGHCSPPRGSSPYETGPSRDS